MTLSMLLRWRRRRRDEGNYLSENVRKICELLLHFQVLYSLYYCWEKRRTWNGSSFCQFSCCKCKSQISQDTVWKANINFAWIVIVTTISSKVVFFSCLKNHPNRRPCCCRAAKIFCAYFFAHTSVPRLYVGAWALSPNPIYYSALTATPLFAKNKSRKKTGLDYFNSCRPPPTRKESRRETLRTVDVTRIKYPSIFAGRFLRASYASAANFGRKKAFVFEGKNTAQQKEGSRGRGG